MEGNGRINLSTPTQNISLLFHANDNIDLKEDNYQDSDQEDDL